MDHYTNLMRHQCVRLVYMHQFWTNIKIHFDLVCDYYDMDHYINLIKNTDLEIWLAATCYKTKSVTPTAINQDRFYRSIYSESVWHKTSIRKYEWIQLDVQCMDLTKPTMNHILAQLGNGLTRIHFKLKRQFVIRA